MRKKKLTPEDRAKRIVDWIKTHPEFKWSAMCVKLKMDKGNFQRVINSPTPKIKEANLGEIEKFIANYGFSSKAGQ